MLISADVVDSRVITITLTDQVTCTGAVLMRLLCQLRCVFSRLSRGSIHLSADLPICSSSRTRHVPADKMHIVAYKYMYVHTYFAQVDIRLLSM